MSETRQLIHIRPLSKLLILRNTNWFLTNVRLVLLWKKENAKRVLRTVETRVKLFGKNSKLSIASPEKSTYMTEYRDVQAFVIRTFPSFLTQIGKTVWKRAIIKQLFSNHLRITKNQVC